MSEFRSRSSRFSPIFDENQLLGEGVRRVNQAVFISKDRQAKDSEDEDSDSCSVASTLMNGPLEVKREYDSDSSTTQTVTPIISTKRVYDPSAYDRWLKAKNESETKRKEQERMRKRREEAKKKMEEEKRKQENEEKLKRWMERKEQEKQKQKKQQEKKKKNSETNKKWLPNEESITNFNVWLSRVKQQEEQTKLRQLAKQRMEEEFKQQRQDLSKMFYDEWLKTSKSKPKPVPLNRGTESLRGTISELFINPKPWQTTSN
ncbi:uncharacterized protein LOC131434644 [Malaya genurostris]|uniref:uncharacterized protein LOC131434644 n=1 Tax=Malaya genurostris TaxID=325434 RepID=UPI0026F3AF26|nr:uncharacterized protein LOC131434644 [Malaya genurostris]